jgi:hypothetical protein
MAHICFRSNVESITCEEVLFRPAKGFLRSLLEGDVASARSWAKTIAAPATLPARYEWLQNRLPQPTCSITWQESKFSPAGPLRH